MTQKQVYDLHLFRSSLSIRDAAKGFILACRVTSHYSTGYLGELELSAALLADYAEAHDYPPIGALTTEHLEEYLVYLRERPRWFGARRGSEIPPSDSYVKTQYTRLKTFFNWLKARGHIEDNPLALVRAPRLVEKLVETIPEQYMILMLGVKDPAKATNKTQLFHRTRDRAALYLLWDTPSRRAEIAGLTVDRVLLDQTRIKVLGKGRKERWMGIADVVAERLWEYKTLRDNLNPRTDAFWVDRTGKAMSHNWIYLMLKRLGPRIGYPGLHTHQFRHTYTVAQMLAGEPVRVLEAEGGWRRIPATYTRTIDDEVALNFHRESSPAARLGNPSVRQSEKAKRNSQARGRL